MIKQTTALSLQAHHAQAKVLYELVSGEAEDADDSSIAIYLQESLHALNYAMSALTGDPKYTEASPTDR